MLYEQITRALNDNEIHYLNSKINELLLKERPFSSIILIKSVIGFGIAALLCLLGYFTSRDKPPVWFVLFIFFLPGTIIAIWLIKDSLKGQKFIKQKISNFKDAIINDKVKEERIQSERMVEIHEFEDEGACYLFEVEPKKLFLLFGQQYYATSKFPSSDFSLIDILDSRGNSIDSIIQNNGTKLKPYRVIDSKDKIKDMINYESKFIDCGIDDID